MTPHCASVLDKIPRQPGFVCNISTDRIMTSMMDDITGAVQQSPERQAWWRLREVRAEAPLCTCSVGEGRLPTPGPNAGGDTWERAQRMWDWQGTKWGRKFINRAYVRGLIRHFCGSLVYVIIMFCCRFIPLPREAPSPFKSFFSNISLVSLHLTASRMLNWCAIVLC